MVPPYPGPDSDSRSNAGSEAAVRLGETDDPRSVLVEYLFEPDRARERLPYIVGLFESDERPVRIAAAWVCCLVASEADDDRTVEYLVRRLADRLGGNSASLELTQTLDYLSARYPEEGQERLDALVDRDRERRLGRGSEGSEGRDGEFGDVGTGADGGEDDDSDDGVVTTGRGAPDTIADRTRVVSTIAERSRFDGLHVVGARHSGRYADTYEALIGQGGERTAVALRLLRLPERTGLRSQFADAVGERLGEWVRIHDHDGVVTVLDWGVDPQPWLATAFTGDRLSDRDGLPVERALRESRALAEAVSHAHQHGVVHAGIDPTSVAYPGELLEGGERLLPMLDGVGLLHVLRYYFDPSLCLDPRYAAPEYFDDRCGPVDHATDIYQLGATVFWLLTGRHPYDGDFSTIREGVLGDRPPRPSEVADVPAGTDDVVSKAMATQKLTRYETIEHMERELADLIDG